MAAFDKSLSRDSEDDELDFNSLPFPKPIPSRAFISPDFNPDSFLSTSQKHQTLKDIRSELSLRAQSLHNELVELVNRDYEEFVGLGGSLKGGEEQIDELIKELENFINDTRGLRDRALSNLKFLDEKMAQKKRLQSEKALAKNLFFLLQYIEELEMLLESRNLHILDPKPTQTSRLWHSASKCLLIQKIMTGLNPNLPIITLQLPRVSKLRQDLSSQLETSLRDAIYARKKGVILEILRVYRMLDNNPTYIIKKFMNSYNGSPK